MTEPRLYDSVLRAHLGDYRQMVFVTGPRQVGKTTTCRAAADAYLDWDNQDHQSVILAGPGAIAEAAGLNTPRGRPLVLVLDEVHKYRRWRQLLKGFYDTYSERARVVVTGSSRFDVYRRGGDSLMGRYLPYRMHPLTIAELADPSLPTEPIRSPSTIEDADFSALWEHGGFPEPLFLRRTQFSRRWRSLRQSQFVREDLRDLTRVQELSQLEHLVRLLAERSGQQAIYSRLGAEVRVTENTIRSWLYTLSALHYGFLLRPWFENVSRSLRKEPKWFLRDWSTIADPGQRAETFVACHLLKAVEGWTDLGFGEFELAYLRDKEKREVDFVVVRDGEPWFLVEVKQGRAQAGRSLRYFQKQLGPIRAFVVVMGGEYVDADCFSTAPTTEPWVVSARAFLSQLL